MSAAGARMGARSGALSAPLCLGSQALSLALAALRRFGLEDRIAGGGGQRVNGPEQSRLRYAMGPYLGGFIGRLDYIAEASNLLYNRWTHRQ